MAHKIETNRKPRRKQESAVLTVLSRAVKQTIKQAAGQAISRAVSRAVGRAVSRAMGRKSNGPLVVPQLLPRIMIFGNGVLVHALIVQIISEVNAKPGAKEKYGVVIVQRDNLPHDPRLKRILNYHGFNVLLREDKNGKPVDKAHFTDAIVNAIALSQAWSQGQLTSDWKQWGYLEYIASPMLEYLITNGTETGWNFDPKHLKRESAPTGDQDPGCNSFRLLYGLRARHMAAKKMGKGEKMPHLFILPAEHIADNARVVKETLEKIGKAWEKNGVKGWRNFSKEIWPWINRHCSFLTTMVDRLVPGNLYDYHPDTDRISRAQCITRADHQQIAIQHPEVYRDPGAIVAETWGYYAIAKNRRLRRFLKHPNVHYLPLKEILRLQDDKYFAINGLRQLIALHARHVCRQPHAISELYSDVLKCPVCLEATKIMLSEIRIAIRQLTGRPSLFSAKAISRMQVERVSGPLSKTVGGKKDGYMDLARVKHRTERIVAAYKVAKGKLPPEISRVLGAVNI